MPDHQVVKIPLTDIFYDELDDAFIDQKITAHDFIWGELRKLASDGKMGYLNKSCVVNIVKDGQPAKDTVMLRGLELEEIPSNPDWIAKNMEKEEVKYFEHKVTDKSWKYLKLFASFSVLRHLKFGEAIQSENDLVIERMAKAGKSQEEIEEAKKRNSEALEKFLESKPKCIEETIFNAIYPAVYKHVTANVDNSLDKENETLYPKEEKPATTKA